MEGGKAQSHIKGIGPRITAFGSIRVIFHLKRIAKHLALSVPLHLCLP